MSRAGTVVRGLRVPIGAYVLSRLGLLLVVRFVTLFDPDLTMRRVLGVGWDGRWYVAIARGGYPSRLIDEGAGNRWAFFPGLPALIRGLHVLGIPYDIAGTLLSFALGLVAVVLVFVAVREVAGEQLAGSTAALLAFFPTAFVFGMIYTEGLFLVAAAGALLALHRKQPASAAIWTTVAVLTRVTGVVLIAVLAVEALRHLLGHRDKRLLWWTTLPIAAFVAWCGYQRHVSGDWLAFLTVQKFWGKQWGLGTTPFGAFGRVLAHIGTATATDWLGAIAFVWVVAAIAIAVAQRHRRSIPLTWWVYSLGSVAVAFSAGTSFSVLRYTMVAFPLMVVVLASIPAEWRKLVIATSAMLQGVLAFVVLVGVGSNAPALLPP